MAARRGAPAAPNWDRASQMVARAYFPHELTLLGDRDQPRLTLQTMDLGPVMLGYVGWGADVEIACDCPGAYEVNLPLTGHLTKRGRHGDSTSVKGQAALFRADTPTLISHWDATCTVLGVKFDRAWLDCQAERVLGSESSSIGGILPDRIDLNERAGAGWLQLMNSLAAHLRSPANLSEIPVVCDQLAGAVSTGFLLATFPDSGSNPVPRPRAISRVVDAVRDDPSRPWTATEMAYLAGTTVRRLEEGFHKWVGCPPMEHLTTVRLQRARTTLHNEPHLSIGEVAKRWGFSSPSRFAAAYRKRYGHPPSQSGFE